MTDHIQAPALKQNRPTPAANEFDFSKWGLPNLATGGLDLSKWGLDLWQHPQLPDYDLPQRTVLPLLLAFRHINTVADALFYDVGLLWLRLYTRGIMLSATNMATPAVAQDSLAALETATKLNLSALVNPEGAILVVDAHHAPFVHKYEDVQAFLADRATFPVSGDGDKAAAPETITIVTVTGVGSSALGSVAFAWNVSETLRRPVAAIVPGYGLADLIPQALGGWLGFGVHDFMRRLSQQFLSSIAPQLAEVGHHLSMSAYEAAANAGKPAFRSGSPESDVLHEILVACPQIARIYGHSKGALCIQNAIRSLPASRYKELHVTTFGCVIQEETGADYNQVLGSLDGLGQLNSWGNWPEQWIKTWHSTNSMLPLTMSISDLVKQDVRDEDPVNVDPEQLRTAFISALKQVLPPRLLEPNSIEDSR